MKSFVYTIKDTLGLHARPAGLLSKTAKATGSRVSITKDGKNVSADRILSLMGLGIKCGDTIEVTVEGGDEEVSFAIMQAFFEENL